MFVANFTREQLDAASHFVRVKHDMVIHDIQNFRGSIVIADYSNGLLVMDIVLSETFVVEAYTLHSIMNEMTSISSIYVETKWQSDTVLLTCISPAVVYEISLKDKKNPLYEASFIIPDHDNSYVAT